jgi:hypothetical protein
MDAPAPTAIVWYPKTAPEATSAGAERVTMATRTFPVDARVQTIVQLVIIRFIVIVFLLQEIYIYISSNNYWPN